MSLIISNTSFVLACQYTNTRMWVGIAPKETKTRIVLNMFQELRKMARLAECFCHVNLLDVTDTTGFYNALKRI